MPGIPYICPHCRTADTLPDYMVGQKTVCQWCKKVGVVSKDGDTESSNAGPPLRMRKLGRLRLLVALVLPAVAALVGIGSWYVWNAGKSGDTRQATYGTMGKAKDKEQVVKIKKAEQSKNDAEAQKELERQRAEAKAAWWAEARRAPVKIAFKDLKNFPEDYQNKVAVLSGIWFHGGLRRVREHSLFTVTLSSRDGSLVYSPGFIGGKELIFTTSETFGRRLDSTFEADMKYGANVYCDITKIDATPVGRIYKVERLTIGGDVKDVYDDR